MINNHSLLLGKNTKVYTSSSVFVPITELGNANLRAIAFLEYSNPKFLNKIVNLPTKFIRASGSIRIIDNSFGAFAQLKKDGKLVFSKISAQSGVPSRRIKLFNLECCKYFPIGAGECVGTIERITPEQNIQRKFYASAKIQNGEIQLYRDNGYSVVEDTSSGVNEYGQLNYNYSLEDLNKIRIHYEFMNNNPSIHGHHGYESMNYNPSIHGNHGYESHGHHDYESHGHHDYESHGHHDYESHGHHSYESTITSKNNYKKCYVRVKITVFIFLQTDEIIYVLPVIKI